MESINTAVFEYNGEATSAPPLRQSVKKAIENYLHHLDGQTPVNLYELVLEQIEEPLIEITMRYCHQNQSLAAKILGISRGTLRKKLKKYNLDD